MKKITLFQSPFEQTYDCMPVYYYGKVIPENVCNPYNGNEADLYRDLGDEKPTAIRCLTRRLKPSVQAEAAPYRLTEEEIDDIVTDTVIKTIINIQRARP